MNQNQKSFQPKNHQNQNLEIESQQEEEYQFNNTKKSKNTKNYEDSQNYKKNDDDNKKNEIKISNINIPGVSQKKINEFIKVINGMSFNDDEKNNILNLLSTNNEKIMQIFNKFQKNKLSLTKKVLLNLLSETKKKSAFKKKKKLNHRKKVILKKKKKNK